MDFASLFRFRPRRETAAVAALYDRIVAQARQPAFFATLGVPDSLDGRFETLALHTYLVLNRLKADPVDSTDFAQALFDMLFADMDRSLREMGASDLGVGRRVKAMAEGLYGRIHAYDRGLVEGTAALEFALRRNLYGTASGAREADVAAMARYLRSQQRELARQSTSEFRMGHVEFLPVTTATAEEARE